MLHANLITFYSHGGSNATEKGQIAGLIAQLDRIYRPDVRATASGPGHLTK